jgi:hypothetical protein
MAFANPLVMENGETYLLTNKYLQQDPSLVDRIKDIVVELGGKFDGPVNADKYFLRKGKQQIRPLPAIADLTDKLHNIQSDIAKGSVFYEIKIPKSEFNFFLYQLYDTMVDEKLDLLVTSRVFRKTRNAYEEVDTTMEQK